MADKSDRTEKPTPKHKKELRDKGTVARSAEVGSWASLLVVVSLLPWLGGMAANRISGFLQNVTQAMGHPDVGTAVGLLGQGLTTAALAALPILVIGGGVAVAIAFGQVGLRLTPKALRFQFSRISPKAGFGRLFSTQGVWTLGKTLAKMAALAIIGYLVLTQLIHSVVGDTTLPLPTTLSATSSTVIDLMRDIGVLALVVAGADYAFQRRSYQRDLRMTKQEVRDERRQSDGSPELRRAVRRKARRLSRMHMMAAVATADVVVANPTHFAVALAYDRTKDRAPRVVAKGVDVLAAEMRDRARIHGVPVVVNPPLARSLHAACEVDDTVPPQLFAAAARLLAFVYALSPTARAFGNIHQMAS
jgi:flagellar biosynthesis protein FlhB